MSGISKLAYDLDLEIEMRVRERSPKSKKPRTPVKVLAAA
jgi:hypothetical protein